MSKKKTKAKLNKYLVTIPIAGAITTEIEAATEGEAIEAAMEKSWIERIETTPDFDLHELESYEHLMQGNVFYASFSEAEAELIEGEEPDEDEDDDCDEEND